MQNPFLIENNQEINFSSITKDHVTDATKEIVEQSKKMLAEIFSVNSSQRNFENTILALDNMYNKLVKVNEVISLLAYVHPVDDIRNECLGSISELGKFFNEISLNEDLYNAVKEYSNTDEAKQLSGHRKKYLKETVEEFERNGFALPKEKRSELKLIQDKLSDLSIAFESNISTYQDFLVVTKEQINGLPEDYKKAHRTEEGNYKITLEYPDFISFMKYSTSDEARKELSRKYKNKAADKNLEVLKQMLVEREKMVKLLGFETFAVYRTENRMAKNPQNVWKFENELKEKVRKKAELDYSELLEVKRKYKNDQSISAIESWEAAFYDNLLLEEKYELDNQKLKEYFEVNNVIDGLFRITQHLYGLTFEEEKSPDVWHDEVRFFRIKENNKIIARFYLDLYPRANKYGHAAMFGMIPGKLLKDEYQLPTASLVCNFPRATDEMPALMLHDDVVTFFHEFGHLMHDLLTRTELSAQAGTNVARDFVEMPSQIFENWAWDFNALQLFAKHYKSNDDLPRELFEKMIAARNVGSGLQTLQQIFYGTLDLTYHDKYNPAGQETTTDIVRKLQNEITLYKFHEGTHFEAGFGHLSGYAAGYYSYLWAKVFSEDMFSVFVQKGVMDKETGLRLRNIVLEKGSSVDELEMVKEFLGREPNQEAFLKSIGL